MEHNLIDTLDSGRRFVLGTTASSRLEIDYFNLYAWLTRHVSGKRVLDVACGSGLGSFLFAHKAKEVLGMDLSPDAIEFAQSHYRLPNLKFIVADILNYDIIPESFEVIISALTLEQIEVEKQREFLKKLKLALTDDGLMILVTPNKKVTSPYRKIGIKWNTKEFSLQELRKLFDGSGLEPIEWHGQRLVFFLFTNYFFRKAIGAFEKIFKKKLGFYGVIESAEVKKLKFYWQPKQFIILIRKK